MLHALPALLLAATACRYYPLDEAPIYGASPEVEAAIRSELIAFDDSVGPGRTRISGVWIDDLPDGRSGQVRRGSRKVQLDETLGMRRDTLTHELCHALDADENLWRDPLMEELAEGLFDDDYAHAPTDRVATRSARARQREAFASFCETGAVAAHAMASPCPDDPDELADIASWYASSVFRAWSSSPLTPREPVASPTGSVGIVWPTEDPGVVVVLDEDDQVFYVDLYTGALLAEDDHPLLDLATTTPPPGLIGLYDHSLVEGTSDGPFAARMTFWLHHLGVSAPRFVGLGSEGWQLEAGDCSLDGERLFPADEAIWMQQSSGWTELVR